MLEGLGKACLQVSTYHANLTRDRLAYDGWVCVVTSIDREKCTIDVVSATPAEPFDPGIEDFTPPIDGAEITPDFVDAWPWELEQKGGSEQ